METELFLALAEISGVFVGFGALISVRSPEQEDPHTVVYLRAVMGLGVWVLAAALLPVAVSRYGIDGRALWQSCALVVLAIYAVVLVVMNLTADYRAFNKTASETVDRFFPVIGLPLHLITVGSLLLICLGRLPDSDQALYLTALITAQVFAGYTLLMLVFSQKWQPVVDRGGESG